MNCINQINIDCEEGKLLIAALAMLTTESRLTQTPDEVLEEVSKLKEQIYAVNPNP